MSFLQERTLVEIAGPFDQIYIPTVIAKQEGEMKVKMASERTLTI
jgi:hypothetical protein